MRTEFLTIQPTLPGITRHWDVVQKTITKVEEGYGKELPLTMQTKTLVSGLEGKERSATSVAREGESFGLYVF